MAWWKRNKPTEPVRAGKPARRPLAMALEPRVMFDGAVAATAAQAAQATRPEAAQPVDHAAAMESSGAMHADRAVFRPMVDRMQPVTAHAPTQTGHDVLFVDARVEDAGGLLAHVAQGTDVVFLQQGVDGLQQMQSYLDAHPGARSVQIIAHGNDGDLWLGSTYLSADNVAQHADALAHIGADIRAGGDILIYACNTAAGDKGLSFVSSLAALTQHNVAASNNRTGAGSDWNLEVTTGDITSKPVLSPLDESSYAHDLATITVTSAADSGAGTLRQAIASASAGDIITFNTASMGGSMITLTSGQLVISKNLTIEGDLDGNGTPDVTINANYTSRVFSITGGTVKLDGLTIENGLVSGNGGNSGKANTGQTAVGSAGGSALGGGVYVGAATVTLTHDVITGNRAAGGGGGGAAYNGTGYGGGGGGGYSSKGGGNGGTSYIFNGSLQAYTGAMGSGGHGGVGGFGGVTAAGHVTSGQGGTTIGGAGGAYAGGVFGTGGTGGTAGTIGGGGGGMGYGGSNGGAGGAAAGGIYVAAGGVLNLGATTVSNNAGAGGGGGSTAIKSYAGFAATGQGGVGGTATGGILVRGTLHYSSGTTVFSSNAGAGGYGGQGGNGSGMAVIAARGASNVNTATVSGGVIDTNFTVNAAPVITNLNGDSVSYTERGSSVYLDAGSNASVSDSDNANFNGGWLTASITANKVSSEDVLAIVNQGTGAGQIGISGSNVTYGGVTIGTFTGGTGGSDLVVSFNTSATPAAATALVRALTYNDTNSTDPSGATRTISVTVNDGSGGTSAASQVQVAVLTVNDPPTLTATGGNVTFTEKGSAVDLFSGVSISTIEAGQSIRSIGLSVTNVSDGAAEVLNIDGTAVALTNGNTVTTATHGMSVTVGLSGGVATVAISKAGGISTAIAQTMVDGISYIDNTSAPTGGNRVVTLTSVQDTGGTSNGGVDTTSLAIASTVTVVPVNDAPVVTTDSGSAAFVAGDNVASTPVTVDSGLTLVDVDNATLAYATATITGNFHAGEDILAFTNTNATTYGNIVASYDLSTGTLTLTSAGASASVAQFQAALRAVTYTDSAITPDTATRTISFAANDGQATSVAATRTVTVAATDQTPIVVTTSGSASFVAGDNAMSTPVVVDSGITVTDLDNTTLSSATVSISGNFHAGEDMLSFTNSGNITGVYNAATGVLTLTSSGATATLAQWQAALRSVTYLDTAVTPNNATRTITFTVNDGIKSSFAANRTVSVTDTDQTPIVTTSGGSSAFVQGDNAPGTAVAVDSGITVSDLDNATLASATVAISGNFHAGEDSLSFINTSAATYGNIVATFNSGTGVLTLASSGATATMAQWQAALRAVTYADSSQSPSTATRTVSFSVNDGTVNSAVSSRTVTVTATDNSPVVTATGGTTTYTEGDNTQTTVAVDGGITVSDVDNTTLASATVSITGNFHSGEDILAFTNSNAALFGNIAGSYNSGTGVLTLTSSGAVATLAQWQAALRSVTYADSSDLPNTSSRTVSFMVDDGTKPSSVATKVVSVVSVNDTPINSVPGAQSMLINGSLVFGTGNGNAISVSDADANGGTEQVTLTVGHGTLSLSGTSGLTFLVGTGTGDVTMTIQGSLASINAVLNGLTYAPTAGYYGADALQVTTNDLGNTGSGGAKTDTSTVALTVIRPNPVVTDVSSSSPGGTYKIGDTILVTVTFDHAVTVDTSGGTPTLLLATGSTDHVASYVSGTGSNVLVFSYTVQSGDSSADLDYASTSSLSLNGGQIYDSNSASAVLTLPTPGGAQSIAGQNAIVVDGVAPTVQSVNVPANGTYVAGQNLDFVVNYSEAVTVDTSGGTPAIAITLDTGGTVYAHYVSGSGTSALVFRYTVVSGEADPNGISIGSAIQLQGGRVSDAAGNGEVDVLNSVGSTAGVHVDSIAPTATIALADSALKIGQSTQVTITFSEAVTGFTNADLTVSNGTLSALSSRDGGITWTATFTPTMGITAPHNVITLNNAGYKDLAGNAGVGTTLSADYAIDTVRPTATIAMSDSALKAGQSTQVTITFSEAVTGFSNADLTVGNGTLSAVSSSDGGITWTATFTPAADVTAPHNVITLNNMGYTDLAGNTGVGSTVSADYAIDTARPTATIALANAALKAGQSTQVTITFSEAVTGFSNADLTVGNGTLSAVSSSDGGITWTATFTPAADVTAPHNVITLNNTGYTDLAGNTGVGSTVSADYAIDTARPTATIALANAALKAGQSTQVTITFSEAVTGFSNADLTVGNGTLSAVSSSDGGITWTATFTPAADVTAPHNVITLNNMGYTDLAGNTGVGSTVSADYAIDTARPTATIALANAALKAGQSTQVTITFSEAVTGFSNADLTVGNGTLSAVSSNDGGITWTATFTPAADVTAPHNVITLNNTGYTDLAGNTGVGSTASADYAVDTHAPQIVSISRADTSPNSGQQGLRYTVVFDEAVNGVDASDFMLTATGNAHASIGAVTQVDARTYTVDLIQVGGSGTVQLALVARGSGIADAAGNPLATGLQGEIYTVGGVTPVLPQPVAPWSPAAPTLAPVVTWSPATLQPAELPTIFVGSAAPVSSLDRLHGYAATLPTLAASMPWRASTLGVAAMDAPPVIPTVAGMDFSVPLGGLEVVQLSLVDGRPMPNWVHFDPVSGVLSGTPPKGVTGDIALQVTVRDSNGTIRELPIKLNAKPADKPAAPSRPHGHKPSAASGKPSLATQFGAQRVGGIDHAALLRHLAVAQRKVIDTAQDHR